MYYPPTPQRKACDCSDPCISTDDVYYAGPNLPNSGINTYNVLTEVIEKLDAIYAVPTLQRVTEVGNYTTLPIIADSFVKIGGDGNNLLLDDGTVLPIGDLPTGVTETSQLINDGEDGINPFITLQDVPVLGYTPVNKAGDTMLGDLILNEDPSTALGAATKQYVDNIVTGINFHAPVVVATDVSLVATYDNGVDGVGATLTGPSVGVLTIDGETPTYLQRILVWQQADAIENGIYDLTTVGDALNIYQLTRSADADNSPPGEIHYGDYTLVLSGDTNGGFGFICNTPGTIDIGTTPINYVQFNAAQAITAGYGLQELTPNVISINPLETQEKITLTTIGTTGAATFITNTLNIPTLPQATSSVSGYLTSTDFTTFTNKENSANKQNSLAVDGTGTKFPTVDAVNTLATSLFEQVNVITTNTYTIQASDASNVISFNYPSNSFMTVTMPNNSVIPFPIGTRIKINRIAGLWGINISGTGVDFLRGNQVVQTTASMDGFGGTSTLTKISTNRWRIDDANPFVFSYPTWSSSSNISAGSFSSGWFKGTNFGIDNQAYISFGDTITLNKVNGYFAISGTQTGLNTTFAFGPTAGTAVFNTFNLSPTINQTGGANGITRGLYINPTLTAAADFRAIEVVTGKVIVPTAVNSNEAVNKGQLDNRLVVETTSGYTLTNADSGGIVIFKTTAAQTLTIPTGLADGFECTFVTLSGVTLTVVSTGNTLNNATSTTMLPQLSFTLKRMLAANTYITAGSL